MRIHTAVKEILLLEKEKLYRISRKISNNEASKAKQAAADYQGIISELKKLN